MLIAYGSYIHGITNDKSDVDMYFIPRTDRGYELEEFFILDGIGYDIFRISWKRIESLAKFEDSLSPLLNYVKILFCHSDTEIIKFKNYQQHMHECLKDLKYMHNCACARLIKTIKLYNGMVYEDSIGCVLQFLATHNFYQDTVCYYANL